MDNFIKRHTSEWYKNYIEELDENYVNNITLVKPNGPFHLIKREMRGLKTGPEYCEIAHYTTVDGLQIIPDVEIKTTEHNYITIEYDRETQSFQIKKFDSMYDVKSYVTSISNYFKVSTRTNFLTDPEFKNYIDDNILTIVDKK